MEDTGKLKISMLGTFSISYQDRVIDDTKRAMKLWTLLEYLITFRNKQISQNELIDLLWPEGDSDNPINALKTMVHRLRRILDDLGYVPGRKIILQKRGSYAWNTDLDAEIDTDVFESKCKEADILDRGSGDALRCYLEAIALYKGDFLPKSNLEPWATPVQTYYHVMYINCVRSAIEHLKPLERYQEIVDICSVALNIDPYDEFLHLHIIDSLAKMGEIQTALNQYENMSSMFLNYFGITPSQQLVALYEEIVQANQNVEKNLTAIKEQLREKENAGAYLCTYDIFRDIYRLFSRMVARTGASVFVGLISAIDGEGNLASGSHLNATMNQMGAIIQPSLRKGDVFSRYSVCQFILMLPSAQQHDCHMVIQRVINRYASRYPNDETKFTYTLEPIEGHK